MVTHNPQFLTNADGQKLSVVISIDEYNALIEELEMADDIRMYDEAKTEGGPLIPAEEVYARIDAKRNK